VTKPLEQAIAAVRGLSDSEQDEAAEMFPSLARPYHGPVMLHDKRRTAVREERGKAPRGEFAGDADGRILRSKI
jgi:hypothetical protein